MYYIPLLYCKPVLYYCILYLNVLATIEVLCWKSSDATGLKCDGASLNHFNCVFLLLYLAFRTRTTWRLPVMRHHPHNESLHWVWQVSPCSLWKSASSQVWFHHVCCGVIYRLLLLTISSLSWRLQMTQHLWRDDTSPWGTSDEADSE